MKEYTGIPMRFAHTGVTQYCPENTLDAFKKAAELHCEGIELDINISKDGEIIVTHNSNLEYMTQGKDCRELKSLTAEEIKAVDIPYRNALKAMKPPVPWTEQLGGQHLQPSEDDPESRVTHLCTFPEFDRWLSTLDYDMTIEVEFKDVGMCDRMDEILKESDNISQYIFFSGDRNVLTEMQQHYREKGKPQGLRLGANIRFVNEDTMEFIKDFDLYEVGLNNEAFTKEDVEMLAERGIKVFSNLGDYTEWWSKLAPLGVTGFKTNYPEAYTEWWESTVK